MILVAVAAVIFMGRGEQPSQSASEDQPPRSDAREEQPSRSSGEKEADSAESAKLGHPALGSKGAPVTMIEYSDYQ